MKNSEKIIISIIYKFWFLSIKIRKLISFYFSRILAENEAALDRTNAEFAQVETQIENFISILEKEALEQQGLAEKLSSELRDKMTQENAQIFSEKLTAKLLNQRREAELEVS